jgi:hypothetical protein
MAPTNWATGCARNGNGGATFVGGGLTTCCPNWRPTRLPKGNCCGCCCCCCGGACCCTLLIRGGAGGLLREANAARIEVESAGGGAGAVGAAGRLGGGCEVSPRAIRRFAGGYPGGVRDRTSKSRYWVRLDSGDKSRRGESHRSLPGLAIFRLNSAMMCLGKVLAFSQMSRSFFSLSCSKD